MQEFLQHTIQASSVKCFRVLRPLVDAFQKAGGASPGQAVQVLLSRMYAPILWRSLKCANGLIRAQAALVFFDVFPLHNTDGSAEEDDALLQRQFDCVTALLRDPDLRVRVNAVAGVCHILSEFWDTLPAATIKELLKYMVNKMATDRSSAETRLCVLRGFAALLRDQPLSHAVLVNLLGFLVTAVHDRSEKVRIGCIELLIQVRRGRSVWCPQSRRLL